MVQELTFSPAEAKLLDLMLDVLSEKLSAASSNDYAIPENTFSKKELEELRKKLNQEFDGEIPAPLSEGDTLHDFHLLAVLKTKLANFISETH